MIINLSKTTLMTQFWPASAVGLISMWIHMGCNIEARQQLECIVQQIFSCHSLDFLLTQNLWRLSDLLSKTHSVKLVWIVLTSSYTNPCSWLKVLTQYHTVLIRYGHTINAKIYLKIYTYHYFKNHLNLRNTGLCHRGHNVHLMNGRSLVSRYTASFPSRVESVQHLHKYLQLTVQTLQIWGTPRQIRRAEGVAWSFNFNH